MKKNLNTAKNVLKMATMVVMLVLLNIAVFAQNNRSSQSGTSDPVAAYLAANANSPLVKLYQAEPTDSRAAEAIKISVVLANDQANSLSASDKQLLESRLKELNVYITKVDAMVNSGTSYARAKATVAAAMEKPADASSTQRKDANGVQIVTIPSQN